MHDAVNNYYICSSCLSQSLIGSFERNIVKKYPGGYRFLNKAIDSLYFFPDSKLQCAICNRTIEVREVCYEKDLIEEQAISNVAEMLNPKIACCSECNTGLLYEDYSWSLRKMCEDDEEKEQAEKQIENLNCADTIESLFWEFFDDDCWIDHISGIASNMYCPSCGNGKGIDYDEKINHGTFDQYSEIYTTDDISAFNHMFFGDDIHESDEVIDNIANAFEFNEIKQMVEDYIAGVSVGEEIVKLEQSINQMYNNGLYYVLDKGRVVYRARPKQKNIEFHEHNMWEPPYGAASQGRYNESGISVLYCSNCICAVKVEVMEQGYGYSIGKFLINKEFLLFPIDYVFSGEYAQFIVSDDAIDTIKGKKSYLLTNLVSAICKKIGYDGISYLSVKDERYVNYALFCKYEKGRELDCIGVLNE